MSDPKDDELDEDLEFDGENVEFDDDDVELDEDSEEKEKEAAAFNQKVETEEKSSHKKYKKHSLKYDTIFKGKKETLDEDGLDELDAMLVPDKIEIMQGTIVYEEARNPEEYNRLKKLTETVYDILLNHTELNFKKNRRKPSPKDFNRYFDIIKEKLDDNSFSDCDIFVELAFYFSENLFNMFKLLDPEKGSRIMQELKEYQNKKNGADLDDLDFI
jgi:hypothetical protein